MRRILLVEDEDSLRKVIKLNLELENYEVVAVPDGLQAVDKVEKEHFDLIILDLMIPHLSGIDVLKSTRLKYDNLPVIITSAKDTSSDRILGLKTGADDYLTKPFEIEELLLRIQKLLQRHASVSEENDMSYYEFGSSSINFKTFEASRDGNNFMLSQKEVLILKFLIAHKNEVVSRQEILKAVWGYDVFPSTRTIDNFIASLRKHFETDPKSPKHILSVHGVGYKFAG